jgi:hypothetical protein
MGRVDVQSEAFYWGTGGTGESPSHLLLVACMAIYWDR